MPTHTSVVTPIARTLAVIAACATLLLPAASMTTAQTTTDYETLPADPAHSEQVLASAKVSLTQAIEAAQAATGGTALGANAVVKGEGVVYDIACSANGSVQRVVVDGMTGAVTAVKVTATQAVAIATKAVDGSVQSISSDFGAQPPVYTAVVLHSGKIHTISINATDGAVITDVARGQFPGVDVEGELVTLPSGLQYVDIVEGSGPVPGSPAATVEVHYSGYLVDGTKFDSSVDRGQPASFPLGNVIKGWTEGVGSMKVGGKRKLVIPYALAYGPNGRSPVIPPKATLIFDVELLRIVSSPDAAAAPVAPDRH